MMAMIRMSTISLFRMMSELGILLSTRLFLKSLTIALKEVELEAVDETELKSLLSFEVPLLRMPSSSPYLLETCLTFSKLSFRYNKPLPISLRM